MRNKLNILVTGCGGDIGQSIGKILSLDERVNKLFGLDINDRNAGKFIYPYFGIAPRADDVKYIDFLKKFVAENRIDIVIPVAEPELRMYSLKGWGAKDIGTKILMPNIEALKVGFDKMETAKFLRKSGLNYPKTILPGESTEELKYPVILKSRTGSGSKNLYKIRSREEFDYFLIANKKANFILQQYISGDEGEYTCGVFRSRSGLIRTIIFKRELVGGFSGYGELISSEVIKGFLEKIAIGLDLVGSINVQLRLEKGKPYVFEINPRFSSTVYFRYLFGFKDLQWSISDLLNESISEYHPNNELSRFYKGFNEYVD